MNDDSSGYYKDVDEARWLNGWAAGAEEGMMDAPINSPLSRATVVRQRYDAAKSAPVRTMIRCPTCNSRHTKTTYHKVFCTNGKTGGKNNCKDKYWLIVDPERAARAAQYGGK